ncbi:MAG: hypothetical protein U5K51_00170 [Flavobacteriaceae bacterium]|nr:hypothetical protein [Flavobacteriaceae bacterium]
MDSAILIGGWLKAFSNTTTTWKKKEDGDLYNYRQLPFRLLSEIQKKYTNVGWIGANHSADCVELRMYKPEVKI